MGFSARRNRLSEPPCRLLRFEATDGIDLAGLLYVPRRRTARVAVFLHGTGGASVFNSRRTNLLANEFTTRGIAWFAFNNRGAHLVTKSRLGGGMAHERIRDCVHDIDGAVRLLRRAGYRDITLVGHSTGANKIAVYDYYKERNPIRRYILLAGGDDTGLFYQQLGARRFRSVLQRARARRRSAELVPQSVSELPMSWRALHDMINPDGDYNVFPFLEAWGDARLSRRPLFRHVRGIRKASLVIYGENDEYCFGSVSRAVAALAEAVGPKPNFEFVIMKGADHGFAGYEHELGMLMSGWISDFE
ncbi:MAG TPA: alpha/beta hydrolase [Thermoanaerobaculia bacterium]|nr:alpha/beta hydrolase [Thermoanaerobaculia bacterium]